MINNPVAFIGETVNGATTGAPLSADSNGQLSSGISNTEASATSATTTTSTANPPTSVMSGMTITPVSGTYLVIFSGWMTESNGNAPVTINIIVGGTSKADSIRTFLPFTGAVGGANDGMQVGTNGVVTVNGSQAIAIGWSVTGGTATANQRTLNILRVS